MAQLSDYTALLTSEHADKPKYVALVSALVGCLVDAQNALIAMGQAFDLDAALGVQLDAVGLWVGVSRRVPTPITGVYFTWGADGLGWGQGKWKGPFDSDTGLVSLDDETYRLLLRAKIGANHWDGSLAGSKPIYDAIFTGSESVKVQDNNDMSIDVILAIQGTVPSKLLIAVFERGYVGLKPEGVHATYSVAYSPIFGFGAGNPLLAGWGTGVWLTKG
jgi:hypothetical protein